MTEQKIKERNNPGLQTRIMLLCAGALMALLGYVIGTPCGILVARVMSMLA